MAPWLSLEKEPGGWTVVDHNGLREIVDAMDQPREQYPSVQLFVGGNTKTQALRTLYPYNNFGRSHRLGLARVHLSELPRPEPVVIVESGIQSHSEAWPRRAALKQQHHIRRSYDRSHDEVRDLLYRQVLLPLAHTVCFFPEDLASSNSVEVIQQLLVAWQVPPPAGEAGGATLHPHMMVVLTKGPEPRVSRERIERDLSAAIVPHIAAAVTVVDLRDRSGLSRVSRFQPLKQALAGQQEAARTMRAAARLLFSATHLEAIARRSLTHAAQWPTGALDYIRASRPCQAEPIGAAQYLRLFLQLADGAGLGRPYVATVVASAMLMDAFPPGMHEFDPTRMFRTLYADECSTACQAWPPPTAHAFCRAVEREFAVLFIACRQAEGSANLRAHVLRQAAACWSTVKPGDVCLFCLRRPPEHVLPCGHAICDTCASIFGHPSPGVEYHVILAGCRLCRAPFSFVVRLLPPTKRPTLLVLDGGGVRGVITLGYLAALEHELGGQQGLREAVDLTVGTSAGAVIAADMMVRGTRARDAQSKFEALARQIFPARPRWHTRFGQWWELWTTWRADSRHDSRVLDGTLRDAFGAKQLLFDTPAPLSSGTRVALTASRDTDGALCLLCNYRTTRAPADAAYEVPVSHQEPKLHEATRCSVAALGYFTPSCLPGIGTLQDGGVAANCPLRAALRESQIIWPTRTQPDLVVSIGTGYSTEEPASDATEDDGPLRGGFIARAIRTFLSSPAVDGRRGWLDAWDSVPETLRADVFRLDRAIAGPLPELDDAEAMEGLGTYPYRVPDGLMRAWLAKSFFLELDETPTVTAQGLVCRGSVLCCRSDTATLIRQTQCHFPGARFMYGNRDLGAVSNTDGCSACGYYRKRVILQVTSLSEDLQLGISSSTAFRALGGFPTSVQALLDAQQADAPFGRADHGRDRWPPPRRCYCRNLKRTGTEGMESKSTTKRRRL